MLAGKRPIVFTVLALMLFAVLVATSVGAQLLLDDPLQGSTSGTVSGGTFANGGWQVTGSEDYIFWHLPYPVHYGAAEFYLKGVNPNEPEKNEHFHMYDYTWNNADYSYAPGYRDDPYKMFIRKSGVNDGAKNNSCEIVYQDPSDGLESDSAVLPWDPNANYHMRVEWGPEGGNTRLTIYRDGALMFTQAIVGDFKPNGHSVRIGKARGAGEGAQPGAVYSFLKVWDMTNNIPSTPTVTSPVNGSTQKSNLAFVQWNGQSHTQYEVHVCGVSDPNTAIVWNSGQVTSARNWAWTGSLGDMGTYYVFVRLGSGSGWSNWSANGYSFAVNSSYSAPNTVSVRGNSLCDNNGPFLGMGFTHMRALQRCKTDRNRYVNDLADMSGKGFKYQRILTMMGWDGQETMPIAGYDDVGQWTPAMTNYWANFDDAIDTAYDVYGIRSEVTIFADAQNVMPNTSDRYAHMDNVLAHCNARADKIVQIEVANEAWQNGFSDVATVRAYGQYLSDRTSIPISLSSWDTTDTGIQAMNGGSAADIGTVHFSRDTSENGWYPVRDCWRVGNLYPSIPPISSNEPIGPGSSVAEENDPTRLMSAAAFAWISGLPMYVYHGRFGTNGIDKTDGHDVYMHDTPGFPVYQYLAGIIPGDVASWIRNDGIESAAPFTAYCNGQANKYWTDIGGATTGCYRNIGAKKGNEFITFCCGVLGGGATLEARQQITFKVYNPMTNAVVMDVTTLNAGQQINLSGSAGAYIIKGGYGASLPGQLYKTLTSKGPNGTITIDGNTSDWNLSEFTTKVKGGQSGTGDIAINGWDGGSLFYGSYAPGTVLPTSAADHSVKIYSRNDANYLYFLCRCDDSDMRYNNGSASNWLNDCVEFYIDPTNDHGASPISNSTSDFQLDIDANNQKNVYCTTSGYATQILNGTTSAVVRDGTGWWLEVRISKTAIDPDIVTGNTVGVDFNFRDNDNNNDAAQTSIYSWNDSSYAGFPSKIPSNWGDLFLDNYQTPYSGAISIPGTIQAENYDNGGQNISWYDTTAGNTGGQFRSDDVDIEATSDTGGGYDVAYTAAGEWLEYTISAAASGDYTFAARVSNGTAGNGNFRLLLDGTDITGTRTVAPTGGWQNWTSILMPARNVTTGTHILRFVMDNGNLDLNSIVVTDNGPDAVSVDLGNPDINDGMNIVNGIGDGDTIAWTTGGHSCKENIDFGDYYMYFNITDIYSFEGSKPDLYITFDYYDVGTGTLGIDYDSMSSSYQHIAGPTCTNTLTWKTYTFHVTNAYFGNRENGGSDFRITGGPFEFGIDTVCVYTLPAAPGQINVKTAANLTLVIDGNSSDWNLGDFTTKTRGGMHEQGDYGIVGYDSGNWYYGSYVGVLPTSAADHTAKIYGRHDQQYLYFLVRCDDTDLEYSNPASANWANDSVEFFIDPSHDHGASSMSNSTSDIQLDIDCNNQKNVYMTTSAYATQVLNGVTSAVVRDSSGWWLECRILKSALDPDVPNSGSYGVDFDFRDNDNGNDPAQTTVYSWHESSTQGYPSKIPDHWGDAMLDALAADTTPPSPVTNFARTIVATGGQINLTWTNPTDADFAGTKIMFKTTGYPTGQADGTQCYSGTGTSFNHTGLTNGVTYYYGAYAYDEVPNYSTAAQVNGVPVDTTAPGPVTGLTAVPPPTGSQINLSWTNPGDTDFTGTMVRFKTGSYPTGVTDGTQIYNSNGTSYNHTGLTNGVAYYYSLWAHDAANNYSTVAQITATPRLLMSILNVKSSSGLAITIDGNSADWNLAEFTTKSRAGLGEQGDYGIVGYDGGTDYYSGYYTAWVLPTNAADHTGKVYSRHDNTYLYFLVRCDDNDMRYNYPTSANWQNDCVEFYFDPSLDGGANPISNSTSDIQLDIDANNQKNVYMTTPGYASQVLAGVTSAVVRDASGWWLEARIQKSVIDPDIPSTGTFGFDLVFKDNDNDNDPAVSTAYTWKDTTTGLGFPSKIPNNWGRAQLFGDVIAPGNITNFNATPSDTQNSLSWTNPTDLDLTGVKIMFKTTGYPTGPADGTQIYDGAGTSYNHTGLTNGVNYYYMAFAHDAVPNYASGTGVNSIPLDNTAPANITGFAVAAPAAGRQLNLSWTNPGDSDFAGVKIMFKTTGYPVDSNDGTEVYTGTGTSVSHTNLTNGITYYYKAFTFDEVPNYSTGAQITGVPNDTTAPANVTGFAAVGGSSQIVLSWTNPGDSDFTGTMIRFKTGSYPTGIADGTQIYNSNGTTYTHSGLTNGVTYYYKAYAHDAVPNYASGAQASGTPNDTTAPTFGGSISPSTTGSLAPTITITAQDAGSGLNVATADFAYSVDGGTSFTSYVGRYTLHSKGTGSGGGNRYWYPDFYHPSTYTIVSGDHLQYDIYSNNSDGTGSIDLEGGLGNLRDSGITDQNSLSAHPGTNLYSRDYHTWYHRDFNLTAKAGQTLTDFEMGHETDSGVSEFYVRNVVITNNGQVKMKAADADSWTSVSDTIGPGTSGYGTLTVPEMLTSDPAAPAACTGTNGTTAQQNVTATFSSTTLMPFVVGGNNRIKFRVSDMTGNRQTSSTFTLTVDQTPPSNVTSFAAAAGNGQISLSWTNPGSDFAGTMIRFKTGSYPTGPADGAQVYNGTGTSTMHSGLTNGVVYYYKAYAYDAVQNYASGAQVTGTPSSGSSPVTVTVQRGTYGSVIDTYLRLDGGFGDTNLGNTITTQRLYADSGYGAKGPRHLLVRFDLSFIPAGSTINWATFGEYYWQGTGRPDITSLKLSRVQPASTWVEGSGDTSQTVNPWPTWNQRQYGATNWQTAGATGANDIDTATTKTYNLTGGTDGFRTVDVQSFVNGWINGGWTNNGMLLWGGTDAGNGAYYWMEGTSEDSTVANRPYLQVNYTAP